MSSTRNGLIGLAVLTASGAALALGGCASAPSRASLAPTPTELYTLRAADQSDEIMLAPHAEGLSPAQDEAVRALADRWRQGGGRSIQIAAPQGAADPAAAYQATQAVRQRLIASGVPAAAIDMRSYDAAGDVRAPLKVGFVRFQADVPACGRSWGNLAESQDNQVQSNFGCAVTANMAVMIADPADIAAPRADGSADVERRVTVIQAYRKGQLTAAEADSKSSGAVSNAIP